MSGAAETAGKGQKPAGTPREVIAALLILTFTAGVVDAVSLLGLGRVFVANMTGNVVLLGFAIAGASGFSVLATLCSLAGFTAGAGAATLVNRRRRTDVGGWLAAALLIEIAMFAAAAIICIGMGIDADEDRRFVAIVLLAMGMGIRSAAVRDLSVKDLNTTVVTMTMTSLLADLRSGAPEGTSNARRFGAIAAMLLGAVAGALLVLHASLSAALLLAVACSVAGLVMLLRAERIHL
ncbi:MAG: YoaK family protein [Solirubrobacterales bacterium]